MVRPLPAVRAGILAIILTAGGALAACTTPAATPAPPAASAAPSDAMMEHSPSPS